MRNTSPIGTPVTRRTALAAFLGASGLIGIATLGGCSNDAQQADDTAASTEATDAQTTDAAAAPTNSADALAEMAWWQKTIVYEAYPKSFLDTEGQGTGTLAGITAKLDYLAELGVGAIWLTPVYKSPQKDNGYDISDYYDIDPRFGTMADMEELIEQAATRNIRIVMDLVMNHTSDENEWFIESSSSKDNPKADWYIWQDAKEDGSAPTNWRGIFGGSAWTWNETRKQYYLHTFAEFQPDLNWECEEMRKELYRMAKFWLEKGLGGFRIDAVTYIKKPAFTDGKSDAEDGLSSIHAATANTPGILDFLNEFKAEVMEGSDAFAVGEANGVSASELSSWVGENGVFDMIFEFSHILVPQGGNETWYEPDDWTLTQLKSAFTASQEATATNGWYPIYLENHDQARSVSQFLPDCTDTVAGAKMLGTVLLTLRGTPFMYEAEELGYTNVAWSSIDDYDDVSSHNQYKMALEAGKTEEEALEAVHKHSRDNARTPMQWDTSKNAGFTTGKPWLPVHDDYEECNAETLGADPDSALSYYRALAQERNALPVLVAGDYHELMAESEEVYAFERVCGNDRAVILTNWTGNEATYDAALVDGLSFAFGTHGTSEAGKLQPYEGAIFA
ncbi:MAG: alpha-glucosidase [Atopobiaceae bacterium]|nr:alpha-glucosidase [Atopobiaceae bacterium]